MIATSRNARINNRRFQDSLPKTSDPNDPYPRARRGMVGESLAVAQQAWEKREATRQNNARLIASDKSKEHRADRNKPKPQRYKPTAKPIKPLAQSLGLSVLGGAQFEDDEKQRRRTLGA